MWQGQTLGGEAAQCMAAAGSPHISHTCLAGLGHSMPQGLAAPLLLLILQGGKSQSHGSGVGVGGGPISSHKMEQGPAKWLLVMAAGH